MTSASISFLEVGGGWSNSKVSIESQVLVLSDGFDSEHVMNTVMGGKAQLSQEVGFNCEGCWCVSFDSTLSFGS